MATVNSRAGLIQYCLRKLGSPVIQIDVAPEQIEDRIDDALEYFIDFHHDGVDKFYLKHQVSGTDVSNQYFDIEDPLIISVTRMFAYSSANINMFDIRYQIRLNDFYNFNNVSMIHYQVTRQHLALLDFLFDNEPTIRFNRLENRIYVDFSWTEDVLEGDFIIFECYRAVDPEATTTMYNDRMLKLYATALIKEQWGNNLSKYNGIALPGGVTLDGKSIKLEAQEEAEAIRHQIETMYQLPINFEMG
jgi:hypothetical protein